VTAGQLPLGPSQAADADPDVDGVALAAATATGVVLGTRFAVASAWVAATCCLVVACLGTSGAWRTRGEGGEAVAGVLVLATLLASGAAAASMRAAAVRGGVLAGSVRQPARVEIAGAVAEEPRRLRYGGRWVVLTVDRVERAGRTYRTRERAGLLLPRGRLPPPRPAAGSPPARSGGPARPAAAGPPGTTVGSPSGTGCGCGHRLGRPGGATRWGGSRRSCSGIP
jgi:hypothetical protein